MSDPSANGGSHSSSNVSLLVSLSAGSQLFLIALIGMAVIANAVVGYWGYLGFPSPEVLAYMQTAKTDCVNLAQENKDSLLPDGAGIVTAGSQWIRKGKVVVSLEIRKNKDDSSFSSRLCVAGGGYEEIVPGPAESAWE